MTIRPSKRPSETTKQRVKQLRENQTEPERLLWSIFRGRKLGGLKLRRQHPIEPYIVDFYCAEARLVIELDGQSHDDQRAYESQRSCYLNQVGITFMRIANDDVIYNLTGVAEAIQKAAFTRQGKSLH